MKVQSTTNLYYPKTNPSTKSYNNPSFKSGDSLVLIAIKLGASAIKGRKKVKYIEELQTLLNSRSTENFIKAVAALCKTQDSFYDYDHQSEIELADIFTCFRKGAQDLKFIPELRFDALSRIEEIKDTSYPSVQLKKDLINSFFENGHEVSQLLVNKFSRLNDSLYSTFKVEVLDRCLSSPVYRNIRKRRVDYNTKSFLYDYEIAETPCYKSLFPGHTDKKIEMAYNNLSMLSTLDKNIYKNYFSRNRSMIDYNKRILHDYAYNNEDSVNSTFHKRQREYYEKHLKQL